MALTLKENGFTRVWPLLGGYKVWQQSGMQVEAK
jgi:rhodanese-related sulfurtransferase